MVTEAERQRLYLHFFFKLRNGSFLTHLFPSLSVPLALLTQAFLAPAVGTGIDVNRTVTKTGHSH